MGFAINRTSPLPYYYQIEEWLRQRIARGELHSGDLIESETSLAERLGVSRITVRQALNNLTEQGLLVRKRALGTFVAERRKPVVVSKSHLMGLTEEMADEGLVVTSLVLEQQVLPTPEDVSNIFGMTSEDQVVFIRRLRSVNGLPLCVEICYHPARFYPKLAELDLNNRSIYEILDREYNRRPVTARDALSADNAFGNIAHWLQVPNGSAVMRIQRIAWDRAGIVVEVSYSIFRADRHQMVIEYRS